MVSQKKIEETVKKHSSAFKALEEFEKTGRVIIQARLNFTISREIAKEFRDYCKSRKLNMSAKIEEAIRKIIAA